MTTQNVALISDFNIDVFTGFLVNNTQGIVINTYPTPLAQVHQTLLDRSSQCWSSNPDFAVVWTRPEGVIPEFTNALDLKTSSIEAALVEVDIFTDAIKSIASHVRWIVLPSWVIPDYNGGFGPLDFRCGVGLRNLLLRMNLRLIDNLRSNTNVFVIRHSSLDM